MRRRILPRLVILALVATAAGSDPAAAAPGGRQRSWISWPARALKRCQRLRAYKRQNSTPLWLAEWQHRPRARGGGFARVPAAASAPRGRATFVTTVDVDLNFAPNEAFAGGNKVTLYVYMARLKNGERAYLVRPTLVGSGKHASLETHAEKNALQGWMARRIYDASLNHVNEEVMLGGAELDVHNGTFREWQPVLVVKRPLGSQVAELTQFLKGLSVETAPRGQFERDAQF